MNKENLMNTIAVLSKLWDGDVITRVRSEERYRLPGRRLASHLMLQPVIFNKILTNPEMREQGIMARFLTACPPVAGDTGTYRSAIAMAVATELIASTMISPELTPGPGLQTVAPCTLSIPGHWAGFVTR
jgi:hypothetical protein